MSGKRILGLLSAVLGVVIALFRVFVLFTATRFRIAQPIIIAVGGALMGAGVIALKAAPPVQQPRRMQPSFKAVQVQTPQVPCSDLCSWDGGGGTTLAVALRAKRTGRFKTSKTRSPLTQCS